MTDNIPTKEQRAEWRVLAADDERAAYKGGHSDLLAECADAIDALEARIEKLEKALLFMLKHFGDRSLPGDEIDAPPMRHRAIVTRALAAASQEKVNG